MKKLTCALLLLAYSSISFSACYIDQEVACKTGLVVGGIQWTPNLTNRNRLFALDDVQKSEDGCAFYAQIFKAECQPDRSVTAHYYADDHSYKADIVLMDVNFNLPVESRNLSGVFANYINGYEPNDGRVCLPGRCTSITHPNPYVNPNPGYGGPRSPYPRQMVR